MRTKFVPLVLVVLVSSTVFGQSPPLDSPRPIEMRETVWLEELTWMEVRDLVRDGTKTIIVSTGGMEQNGPYLATGKHNYVLQAICPAIARKLGNALCAPIVPFVPEGDIEPPSGMMRYPGSISVTAATYKALLSDIASSLKQHGFEHIIFIGDSGGNQDGMKEVASELTRKWAGSKSAVHYIPEFYDYPGLREWAGNAFGWKEELEDIHDDPASSSMVMVVDPNHVRIKERQAKGKTTINGISLLPVDKAVANGKKLAEHRAEITGRRDQKGDRELVNGRSLAQKHLRAGRAGVGYVSSENVRLRSVSSSSGVPSVYSSCCRRARFSRASERRVLTSQSPWPPSLLHSPRCLSSRRGERLLASGASLRRSVRVSHQGRP